MTPLKIENHTRMLGPPAGIGREDCSNLAIRDIHHDVFGNQMWSKWQPTPKEIELLSAGAGIYLIITGTSHPVVCLAVGTHIDGDDIPEAAVD